jgi:hypothetical protein
VDAQGVQNIGNGQNSPSNIGKNGGGQQEQAPERVRDLAEGCVRFVEQSLGIRLDYAAETLSVLDHYVEGGRKAARERPETALVLAQTAGAYFGEVVRRRYPSWWRLEGADPAGWRIELEPVYLSFSPVLLIADAILRQEEGAQLEGLSPAHPGIEESGGERLELEDVDREAVATRLAELPAVSEQEFYAPSTRLEVIDIAVEAIRARRMADGDDADILLRPEDYAT